MFQYIRQESLTAEPPFLCDSLTRNAAFSRNLSTVFGLSWKSRATSSVERMSPVMDFSGAGASSGKKLSPLSPSRVTIQLAKSQHISAHRKLVSKYFL